MTSVRLSPMTSSTKSMRLPNIDDTYLYFAKEVDPIISPCVAHFLFRQPQHIVLALRSYFDHLKLGLGVDFFDDIECYNPKKSQKVYFTYEFGPVVSKIIDVIAAALPTDVISFISAQLTDADFIGTFSNSGSEQETPSSTTRTKLSDAISLANSIVPVNEEHKPLLARPKSAVKQLHVLPADTVPLDAPVTVPELKNIQITILGSDGGGKTSIINALQGRFELKMKPSLGFKPTTMMLGDNINVKFYDLGGGPKIRGIWSEYYHDVHALIYVFDASLKGEILEESFKLFQSTLEHPSLSKKPLLILANKQDKEGSISAEELSTLLHFQDQNVSYANCSSFLSRTESSPFLKLEVENTNNSEKRPSTPRISATEHTVDPRFESALELFLKEIENNFICLDARVKNDIENKKNEEGKKRLERERKVLKNKIAVAFKEQIDPSLFPSDLPSANPDDTYSETEGTYFFYFLLHFIIFYFLFFCVEY
jgi:small GTP-binding protein